MHTIETSIHDVVKVEKTTRKLQGALVTEIRATDKDGQQFTMVLFHDEPVRVQSVGKYFP